MTYGLYISAGGAEAQARQLEIISHNLANVDTPGFRREIAVLQAVDAEAIQQGQVSNGSETINDIGGGLDIPETITDFSLGKLRATGVKTDVAIAEAPDVFFLVQNGAKQMLTRAGNFQIAADGSLVTQQGFNVLSSGGNPITIDPTQAWDISDDGSIRQGDGTFPLGLVRANSLGDLARVGENLFEPLAATESLVEASSRPSVKNGHLELSSVQPATEMISMIATSRAYEANIKMIQNQDQMLGSLISRILKT